MEVFRGKVHLVKTFCTRHQIESRSAPIANISSFVPEALISSLAVQDSVAFITVMYKHTHTHSDLSHHATLGAG